MDHDQVWRPWDADDEEHAARLKVREMLPEHVKPAIGTWLQNRLTNAGYGYCTAELRNYLETALHVKLPFEPGRVLADQVVTEVLSRGDQFTLRVIDLLVAGMARDQFYNVPSAIDELSTYLDLSASSVTVVSVERSFRIGRRLPDGVEQIASDAVSSADEQAGRHLATAWSAATALQPDPSKAMTEAIRAVESAAGSVVTPKDKRRQLSKIVGAIKDSSGWTLAFANRDDGHPDLHRVLVDMLETLAFAQRDRHAGEAADPVVAIGHVQLASTLVSWFSTGVVIKR